MAKVVSSFASVVRGVSEQVPQDRHPGQMYEQVNMVSDPVRGVARRQGSRNLAESLLRNGTLAEPLIVETLRTYREHSYFMNGIEYSLLYRNGELPADKKDILPLIFLFDKSNNKIIPILEGTGLDAYKKYGLSSVTTAGDYLIASVNKAAPTYSQVDQYENTRTLACAWVRGGAYSRTFTLRIQAESNGGWHTGSYTTMASSYPSLLDTSDIPAQIRDAGQNKWVPNPDYQKLVNDRVNAYNSAATKWVGDAFLDQQPENIAQKLIDQVLAAGFTNINRVGSSIQLTNVRAMSIDDGGDGTLVRYTHRIVKTPTDVTALHYGGKVVMVRAPGQLNAYYLKFVRSDGPGNDFGQGTWIENPAQVVTPTKLFMLGRYHSDGVRFCIAGTPAELHTVSGRDVPEYASSNSGDLSQVSNKPYFLDHPISCITMFHDRLVVVSNGVVAMSRSGDYFNFFRKSATTLLDDDPIEIYAVGAEDDRITRAILYNKDLLLLGIRNQYVISGRQLVNPRTTTISAAASGHGAGYARPAASGNLLFYGRSKSARGETPSPFVGAVAQFQLGVFIDTPETYSVTTQIDKYIKGRPIELATLAAPTCLFVRTDGYDNGVYVYSFIDQPGTQARQFDSWSRWEWDKRVGNLIGITTFDTNMLAFTLKDDGSSLWFAVEEFNMDSRVRDAPYFDSYRSYTRAVQGGQEGNYFHFRYTDEMKMKLGVALDKTSGRFMVGVEWARVDEMKRKFGEPLLNASAQVGIKYNSWFDITPPFLRDSNGRAVLSGNLTIQLYRVQVTDTGGFDAMLIRNNLPETAVVRFRGHVSGRSSAKVGYQPITTTTIAVPVGANNLRHRLRFCSKDWLPFTVTSLEWSGQYFNNARRV